MSKSSWFHVWVPSKHTEKNFTTLKQKGRPVLENIYEHPKLGKVFENPKMEALNQNSKPQNIYEDHKVLKSDNKTQSIQEVLVEYLEQVLNLTRYMKLPSNDGKYQLFLFRVKNESVERVMLELTKKGIGSADTNTSVSVLSDLVTLGPAECRNSLQEEEKFYSTIKSRLMVTEVISRIRAGGSFTFDYLMLVILAGMIAFLGLIENSSVILVASMLVSPIMGPILSGIFGCVIRDYQLTLRGIINEILSLFICILIGFIFGLLTSGLVINDAYDAPEWPTSEMVGRGNTRGLVTGILVAIPSGAGIALSVLGGNAGSLVGVAISASLLPPAVNAGAFWGMAFAAKLTSGTVLKGYDGVTYDESWTCDWTPSGNLTTPYKLTYGCSVSVDTFLLGLVSLNLTIVNIACIIITGFAILSIKEVTPDKIPQSFPDFWKKDIKVHRNYNKTIRNVDSKELQLSTIEEQVLQGEHSDLADTFLHRLFEQAHQDEDFLDITRWVAFPSAPPTISKRNPEIMAFPKNKAYTSMRILSIKELHRQRTLTS